MKNSRWKRKKNAFKNLTTVEIFNMTCKTVNMFERIKTYLKKLKIYEYSNIVNIHMLFLKVQFYMSFSKYRWFKIQLCITKDIYKYNTFEKCISFNIGMLNLEINTTMSNVGSLYKTIKLY